MLNKDKFKKKKVKIEDYVGDTDHLVLFGWMINKLKLKGASLNIFAIIHNYSKSENGYFYGSQNYCARWSNIQKPAANNILKQLVKMGLIHKYGKEFTGSDQVVYYTSNVNSDNLINGLENLEYYKDTYGNNKIPASKEYQIKNITTPVNKIDGGSNKTEHKYINTDSDSNIKNDVVEKKQLEMLVNAKLQDVFSNIATSDYNEEIDEIGIDAINIRIASFKHFLVDNFDFETVNGYLQLPNDVAFSIVDKYIKLNSFNKDTLYKKLSRIDNPEGFIISELRKALKKNKENAYA